MIGCLVGVDDGYECCEYMWYAKIVGMNVNCMIVMCLGQRMCLNWVWHDFMMLDVLQLS